MKPFLSIVALVFSLTAFSQQPSPYLSKLPVGFKILNVNNEEGAKFESDLDNDGIKDLAVILYAKNDNNAILAIFLSSNFKKGKSYQRCEWMHMFNDFELNKNVLTVSGTDMGKYLSVLKMKYDRVSKKMKVTGFSQSGLSGPEMKSKFKLSDAKL